MIDGFDLVLSTPDPPAAAAFYVDVLGAATCSDSSPWRAGHAVAFGQQVIAFRQATEPQRSSPKGIYDAIGLRVVALFVADIDAVCARLEAAGRRVAQGVDLPGKLSIRFARDPDGNTLELIGLVEASPPPHPLQVGLTVRDAIASRAFCKDVLGLEEQAPAPISAGVTRYGFHVGPATLKLWQPLGDAAALPPSAPGQIGIEAVVLHGDGPAPARTDPDGNRIERMGAAE